MRFLWVLIILVASSTGLFAESRYAVIDDTLIFDMTIEETGYEFTGGVEAYDATEIKNYLFDNPNIHTLRITGPGGYGPAGRDISAYLVQHHIKTEAFGECSSACARIFLGGKTRILAQGATLGFHRPWINKETEKRFFDANRAENNWKEEFDYVPWIYDVAIEDVVEGITFLRSRGVDMDFILKIYSTSSYDMWEPAREELIAAGVVTG